MVQAFRFVTETLFKEPQIYGMGRYSCIYLKNSWDNPTTSAIGKAITQVPRKIFPAMELAKEECI